MYAGFKLSLETAKTLLPTGGIKNQTVGQNNMEAGKALRQKLEAFLLNDGSLDATKMLDSWFPSIYRHVFISHSHKDEEIAIRLATWLQNKFSITSFIDSSAWGFCDDLLKDLDNKYCYLESTQTYSYEKRNVSTTHVHTLLSIALAMMLDSCECIIFLNTPNSIKAKDSIASADKETTSSPWIFSELSVSRLIRRRPLIDHRQGHVKIALDEVRGKALSVQYPAPQEHLIQLGLTDLQGWQQPSYLTPYSALDALYKRYPILICQ